MDTPRSFHSFAKLPPELRISIWRHALSPPMVVAYAPDTGFRPIGPTTRALRLACREARRLFGQTHHALRLDDGAAAWISDGTVLRLRNQHESLARLAALSAAQRHRVRHVAVCFDDGGAPWTRAYDQALMRCLAGCCPALRTFILQTAGAGCAFAAALDEDEGVYAAYCACLAGEPAGGAASMFGLARDEVLVAAERFFADSGVRAYHVVQRLTSRP